MFQRVNSSSRTIGMMSPMGSQKPERWMPRPTVRSQPLVVGRVLRCGELAPAAPTQSARRDAA